MAKKGNVMKINNKKKNLSHIFIFFIAFLFAASLMMNVLFCNQYNLYPVSEKTSVTEIWITSENTVSNENGDDTLRFETSFSSENNSHTETITTDLSPISMIAVLPKAFSLLCVLIIVFLYFFSTLFRLLPDEWTLIDQKVRLDD